MQFGSAAIGYPVHLHTKERLHQSSDRILVKFKEDGGADRDGLIQLRRGVDDISLGNAKYAQVRIAVDGTHYLKGMATYSDDIPKGYDIVFNSNKSQSKGKLGAMKEMDLENPENPFGASIKSFDDQLVRAQRHYIDKNGVEQQSALNIVNEEGDWHTSIEIFAVLEGHLEFFMNKEEYPLKAGEQMIINSNEIHSIRAVEKNKTVVLQIPLKQFENYFTAQRFIRFRSQDEAADVKLASLIKKLYKVYTARDVGYEFRTMSLDYLPMQHIRPIDYQ